MRSSHSLAATALAVALSLPVLCQADSFVWKVSKGGNEIYLGGTIHILTEAEYPLPPEFGQAYDKSETLVFETDIDVVNSVKFQNSVASEMFYMDGSTLQSRLKEETWTALLAHAQSKGFPEFMLNMMRPGVASMSMAMLEYQSLGFTQEGVDQHFDNKADTDGKPTLELETPTQQVSFVSALGQENPDKFIMSGLDDLKMLPTMVEKLVAAWRKGDRKSLNALMVTEMQEKYPAVYQSLLVERNNNWMPAIIGYFDTQEVEFVLVGAAHLVGDDGLLQQLSEKGYTIEQL